MSIKNQNSKIIFGLKLRQIRQEKGLLFDDLAKKSGISASYLNEMEKGKKYPKSLKLQALASALEVSVDELVSEELSGALAPVGNLLHSNFLNELPLDLFGIELAKVVQIIAGAPKHVGAFISTMVELGRSYAVQEGNFYHRAMRAYQELNFNYFEEIEQAAATFIEKNDIPSGRVVGSGILADLLKKQYGYTIDFNGLNAYPELQFLRAVYVPNKKQLLLNNTLSKTQQAFQIAKELGFQYLQIKERAHTSSLLEVNNFEEVYNHFKASYFAAAVLIDEASLVKDIKAMFSNSSWSPQLFQVMLDKYKASPEMLLHRIVSMLPKHFGLSRLYFIRCTHNTKTRHFEIDKELHLNHSHLPHGNGLLEHYCRRWQTLSILKELEQQDRSIDAGSLIGIQRNRYHGTDEEYLCFTFAHPAYSSQTHNVSLTVGIMLDDTLKEQISFWNDPAIPFAEVNVTCQRCPIMDCSERVAEASIVKEKRNRKMIRERLDSL